MKRSIIIPLMIQISFSKMPGYDLCRSISDVEFDIIFAFLRGKKSYGDSGAQCFAKNKNYKKHVGLGGLYHFPTWHT